MNSKYTSHPKSLEELLHQHLRQSGLETPLLQRRVINLFDTVAGEQVAKYTGEKFIRNQTLFVKVTHAALRADLTMMRRQLCDRLNKQVGSMIISDIKFY